jgi:hypothetical protein
MLYHNLKGRSNVGHPRKSWALWRQNRSNVWPLQGRWWWFNEFNELNTSWWKCRTHMWCQWKGHGYGTMLLIMAGEMPPTSRQPDTKACELWMKWSIIQMPSAERTYILNWMTLPKSWTFHWVVCRVLSTSNSIAEKSKHTGYRSTLLFITKPVVQGSLIHLTHYTEQEERFLQYPVTHDETWVNCTTPETKKASTICKHPSHHTAKAFKQMPSVKKTQ